MLEQAKNERFPPNKTRQIENKKRDETHELFTVTHLLG